MDFKQYLIEISKKELEEVNLDRDLLFDNIFGDKLRILIPLGNEELDNLINTLSKMDYEVDHDDLVSKKIVYKKVATRAGMKKRPEKVGGLLQTLIKNHDKIKSSDNPPWKGIPSKTELSELLDWWQKNSGNLEGDESGYSVVISRSPIDLVRMSDHDNISSCHSPGGGFFKCAKQEAKTGGAVAYVVKNSDIKGVNLQDKEIFEDGERKIKGIVPLERLRIRRFSSKNKDILIPDGKTYSDGMKHPGFLNSVMSWAKSSQKEAISTIDPLKDYKDMSVRGGSYFDTGYKSDFIWNRFFNTSVTGVKDSADIESEDDDSDNLEERAERQLNNHKPNWKNFDVNFEVYGDDDRPYLIYSANSSFSIPIKLFTIDLEDPKQRNNLKKVEEIIEENLDIYRIENLDFQIWKDEYLFQFTVEDEPDGYTQPGTLLAFEHFLDYIDESDSKLQEKINKVYAKLIEEGYLKNVVDKIEFQNFDSEIDDYDYEMTLKSTPEKLGYFDNYPVAAQGKSLYFSGGGHGPDPFARIDKVELRELRPKLLDYINHYNIFPFKLKENEIKIYILKSSAQGWSHKKPGVSGTMDGDVLKPGIPPFHFLTGWVYFHIEKTLSLNIINNKNILKKVMNVDRNYDFYIKKLQKLFDLLIKAESNAIKQAYPNVTDIESDPDYTHKLRAQGSPFHAAMGASLNIANLKLPKKPIVPPKSPYVQKQFKFEHFRNWVNKFK
jgi:hypothetical protein